MMLIDELTDTSTQTHMHRVVQKVKSKRHVWVCQTLRSKIYSELRVGKVIITMQLHHDRYVGKKKKR